MPSVFGFFSMEWRTLIHYGSSNLFTVIYLSINSKLIRTVPLPTSNCPMPMTQIHAFEHIVTVHVYVILYNMTLWNGVVGRVDNVLDSRLKDMGSNPAEAGHCVTTVVKLFTPTLPSWAEGRLNQMTLAIADTSVATLHKSFTCVGSGLLSL